MEEIKVASPVIGNNEIEAVKRVLKSGNFTSGHEVDMFEKEFSHLCNKKYGIAVNSGTAALHLALLILGVGPGDEVIVPALSFFATASCVLMCGADVVFAEVDAEGNMEPEQLEWIITPKTKAIIPVHLYGFPCDIVQIMKIANKYNIPVVEDCAQAHGASINGRSVGSFGAVNCFSFFATKNMTTIEGGMLVTNNEDICIQAKLRRSHGMTDRDTHTVLGYNYRMNEISAAIGREQLTTLEFWNNKRRAIAQYYDEHLNDTIRQIYKHKPNRKPVFFWYPISLNVRLDVKKHIQELRAYLSDYNIGTRFRYTVPMYKQPIFKHKYETLWHHKAEMLAGGVLGLPINPDLSFEQLDRVIEKVNSFTIG